MGRASRVWETTSGGVRMAAMMKIITIAYLKLRTRNPTESRPMRAKMKAMSGSSKTRPKTIRVQVAKEKASLSLGLNWIQFNPKLNEAFRSEEHTSELQS